MRVVEERAPVVMTPEHVPIRLFPAGLGIRFIALIVDFMIVMLVNAMVYVILSALLPFGLGMGAVTAVTFVIQWAYHVWFEVRRQGQTPGKALCRLRVVDRRGLPITFQQSFVRNMLRALDFAPAFYGVGGLVSLLDRSNRRVGDIVADTLVIHERKPPDASRHLAEARRFNTLRTPRVLRRIRHQVSLEEREFLLALCLRAPRMDAKARFDLMEETGNHYRDVLGVDDPHLSGENLVRGLLSILFEERT